MKNLIIIFSITLISFPTFSQVNNINEVALSTPLVWNQTTIFNSYSGARAADKTGNALSNGFNINYYKTIYKAFYAKVGIGYFKQKFGITRPFDFKEIVISTNLLYSTKYYQYKNLQYFIGLGYNKSLNKRYNLLFSVTYNYYNTKQQEFRHSGYISSEYGNPQKRKENYHFGSSINFQAGVSKKVYKNFRIGLDILFPISTKWRKDEIFREDDNEFYKSDFSVGTSINLIYSFNKK